MPLPQVTQALLVLTGAGYVYPAQEFSRQGKARCAALNRYICERARSGAKVSFLASPVCASGIMVPSTQQLFLLACQRGRKSPKDQAEFVWDLLTARGQRIVKDGLFHGDLDGLDCDAFWILRMGSTGGYDGRVCQGAPRGLAARANPRFFQSCVQWISSHINLSA